MKLELRKRASWPRVFTEEDIGHWWNLRSAEHFSRVVHSDTTHQICTVLALKSAFQAATNELEFTMDVDFRQFEREVRQFVASTLSYAVVATIYAPGQGSLIVRERWGRVDRYVYDSRGSLFSHCAGHPDRIQSQGFGCWLTLEGRSA